MAVLTRFWKEWTARYVSDGAYWYVPTGKSIGDIATIQQQLIVLAKFEGQRWRESQPLYLAELKNVGLSKAETRDPDERGTPMSRMLAQVFSTLGFAWIDQSEAVTLTPAGETFMAGKDPADFGFTFQEMYKRRGLGVLAEHHLLGFFQDDDAARQAAHKKAREWLDKHRKKKPRQQPRQKG